MNRNIKPTQGPCQHLRNPDGGLWCGYTGPNRWWPSPEPLPICVACHFAAMRWTADARDAAEAALERVRALHKPTTDCESGVVNGCYMCINIPPHCGDCYASYPCPTIEALDGSEPYWPCPTIQALDGGE